MLNDPVVSNDWHAICFAADLNETPKQAILMEERIVLFRSDGTAKAFKDLCIHRGAALSLGKVRDGCLVCPYHGWSYDSGGRCVSIPQLPRGAAIPLKAQAVTYACVERYGIIWVSLNAQAELGRIPLYEEADDPAFHTVSCGPFKLQAAAPRIVENFLDVSHLAFLHEGYLGDSEHPEISPHEARLENDRIVSDEIGVYQPDPDGRGLPMDNYYVYEVLRPLTARLKKTNKETGETFSMLFAALPEGERFTSVFILVSRNYAFDLPDEEYRDFQKLIIEQDAGVVESQRPELLPLDLQEELHLRCDRISIAYRRWLSELGMKLGTSV
ncbi:aromatic ring-hydroxylating dioxygenase subunit alpha [Paenibacillus cremeus]|uniref:Aromatic ring-hydroxylating dioxygenase subunit alpha n=1 Tax=Paenibacillus cremeus TaxID=2163881 RepID=A0A559KGI3_9BACL|nr:aromatic ring-hydroxylating dioxygenase subunit alpha [Paenibacillus cremeus]TVY11247.1 aromatic ring-hydroxylating dioxygenase subunit alpha [Paenibacillus cremeus]